jgi:hypothetical protein
MHRFFFLFLIIVNKTYAQVGIGTNTPHASAILELNVDNLSSTNKKGLLLPRVALTSNTDQVTIASPSKGLLVYNLGTSGLSIEGFLYWSGTEWRKLNNTNTATPNISAIDCESAKLTPSSYTANTSYTGTLVVPYFDGNGGSYNISSILNSTGVTGLTATLQPGDLANGYGYLVYKITGTPSASSPSNAIFTVPSILNGLGCPMYVGSGKSLQIGETLTKNFEWVTSASSGTLFSNTSATIAASLPTIEGLRMDIFKNDNTFYTPRIYNISSNSQLVSYQTFSTQSNENKTALNQTVASGGSLDLDNNGICYWTTSTAEVVTTNLQVQIGNSAPYTYRWYEFKWWCMEVGTTKKIFMAIKRNS